MVFMIVMRAMLITMMRATLMLVIMVRFVSLIVCLVLAFDNQVDESFYYDYGMDDYETLRMSTGIKSGCRQGGV